MKQNIGNIEVMIRFLGGVVAADLAVNQMFYHHASWLYWVIAVVLLVTSFTGYCPLYALFHRHHHGKGQHQ